MNDINKNCEDNLGGVILIRVIPVDDVQSIATAVDGKVCEPVVLKTGKRWYDIYCTPGSMKFSEEPVSSEHGDYYNAELIGTTPKDRTDVRNVLEDMKTKKFFIVDYTDANNERKLVGTITEPLKFTSSLDTGNKVPTMNSHTLKFSGAILEKSLTYFI